MPDRELPSAFTGAGTPSRRAILRGLVTLAPLALLPGRSEGQPATPGGAALGPLEAAVLPAGIRARVLENINGIRMHILEAGFETAGRRALLLVHGFPELAYSWRKVMLPLAAAGYHVFAPDVRGYGRSGGTDVKYTDDLRPFGTMNRIRDMLSLVSALGYRSVSAVIGHDQGSPLAGWCAAARPDVFRAVAMMSAPWGGTPTLPFNTANAPRPAAGAAADPNRIYEELAALTPPRKHYQRHYQTAQANEDLWHPPQGLHAFLRAYYHMKSADWKPNQPHPLAARTAAEWAKLPRYYVMDLDKSMAATVAAEMPSAAAIAACQWLPDSELKVYTEEYGRTSFQGGLNGYRGSPGDGDLQVFAGRTIDVPSTFISGKSDWGVYQNPGALERLEKTLTTQYRGTHLVDGAGHWVQQEQPEATSRLLLEFLRTLPTA